MIDFIIGFLIGWWISSKVTNYLNNESFRDILRDLKVRPEDLKRLREDLERDESEIPEVELVVEKHGDQLYAFRKDTDEFLAQGPDREALVSRIAERFKNVKFRVGRDEGAEFLKDPAS